MQLAYHTSSNWSTTRVAIYVRLKLQLADGLSWNWYRNGATTSRPGQLQLAYPTGMQLTYHQCCNLCTPEVAIGLRDELQLVYKRWCNQPSRAVATDYPTWMQRAWADTQNRVPAVRIIQSSCPLWCSSSCWNLLCLNRIEWSHLLAGASYIRRRWLCTPGRSDWHGNGDDPDQWI